MTDLEKLAKEIASGRRGAELRALGSSAEARALESAVDGAALEKALRSGDSAALKGMLDRLLSTPEGRALAEGVGKVMEQ